MHSTLLEALDKCNLIVNLMNKPKVFNIMNEYAKHEEDAILHSFKTISATRYIEFMFVHIESVIRNIPIMIRIIPQILLNGNCVEHERELQSVFLLIGNPYFVAQILSASNVFFYAAKMEKEAQGKEFGPFDNIRILRDFKEALEFRLNNLDERTMKLLDTWILNFEYKFNKVVHSFDCNFLQIQKEYSYLSWMKYSENYRLEIKDGLNHC